MEYWTTASGAEGYQVSNQGQVKNSRTGRVLKPFQAGGYPTVRLRGVNRNIHVLMLESFIGERPLGLFACHDNDDPEDNRLDNLRWDTPSSNSQDSVKSGKHFNVSKNLCPREHPLESPNLVPSKLPRRECLSCHRELVSSKRQGRLFNLEEANMRYKEIFNDQGLRRDNS